MTKKFVQVGSKKHYYVENVEPITFICPVKGSVTVDFPVKYFDAIEFSSDDFTMETPLHDGIPLIKY